MHMSLKNYFSFATALMSRMNGGPDTVPIYTTLEVDVSYHEKDGALSSRLFDCCEFLTFVNGSYDAKDLEEMKSPEGFEKPTSFEYETWEMQDDKEMLWKRVSRTRVEGVKWQNAFHTGDGGDRCCAGIANFTFESKNSVLCEENCQVQIPPGVTYPGGRLVEYIPNSRSKYRGRG